MKDFEMYIKQTYVKCPKKLKVAALSTFFFGLIAHMFMYTNPIFVGDSIALYQNVFILGNFTGGRWLGMLLQGLVGGLSLPWLFGLITLVLITLSAYYTCKVLNINRTVSIVVISALMITYPSITASHAYLSSVFVYACALLLSVLAAFHIIKNTWTGYGLGLLFIVLSLGCYQAYVSFTACLLVLFMIRKLLSENDFSFLVWWQIIKMIIVFVIGILIYYFGTVFANKMVGLSFGAAGYAGQEHIGDYGSVGIGSLLKSTYTLAFKYYLDLPYPTYLPLIILIVFWTGMIAAIIQSAVLLNQKGKNQFWRIFTVIGVSLFLPLTMNFVKLFDIGQPAYPHALMTFAFISPWILMIAINEISGEYDRKITSGEKSPRFRQYISWFLLVPSIIFSLFGCYLSNASYLKMNNNYEAGMAIMNRVVTRIETTPGYEPEQTEVILIGLPHAHSFGYDTAGGFDLTDNITGVEETPFWSFHTITVYIEQELQTTMNFGSPHDYKYLEEVQSMPAFPYQDCTKWIDGALVIKLSD